VDLEGIQLHTHGLQVERSQHQSKLTHEKWLCKTRREQWTDSCMHLWIARAEFSASAQALDQAQPDLQQEQA